MLNYSLCDALTLTALDTNWAKFKTRNKGIKAHHENEIELPYRLSLIFLVYLASQIYLNWQGYGHSS